MKLAMLKGNQISPFPGILLPLDKLASLDPRQRQPDKPIPGHSAAFEQTGISRPKTKGNQISPFRGILLPLDKLASLDPRPKATK